MTEAAVRLDSGLYITSRGNGPDLVLLHGWAMHGGVWDVLVDALQDDYRIHVLDLPGHGLSALTTDRLDLESIARQILDAVLPRLNGPAVWTGWSLGGLFATQAALTVPEHVKQLCLIATTPRFAMTSDWPDAMDVSVLNRFADELKQNYQTTLQRFLALQVKGSDEARKSLRELKARILSLPEPEHLALDAGLNILQQTDLREQLHHLLMPVMMVGGEQDMLIPAASLPKSAGMIKDSSYQLIKGAGHAPFISHPQVFIELLKSIRHE